eukprot:TRINITY_DN3866_c0_g1_i1.p1 TRINITY_DN3866_c0_g1~~TRINITY_DN3866_c0_g1_i1.p1  ORF type:complete len:212 (+),score=31.91 TRINITY_DN3866_c0_g1_i1:31-636(+)
MAKVDLKVVLLGQHDVGKTCLVERYLNGRWKEDVAATVGAAFGAKKVVVAGKPFTMGIWDTAGAERYESMRRIYYRSARAAIVCYDITKQDTFAKANFWINELRTNETECALYLVGTKSDLVSVKEVRDSEVGRYAESVGAKVFMTSAKRGDGVEELFATIAEDFHRKEAGSDTSYGADFESLDLGDPDSRSNNPGQSCVC